MRRDNGRLANEAFTSNSIVSSNCKLVGSCLVFQVKLHLQLNSEDFEDNPLL